MALGVAYHNQRAQISPTALAESANLRLRWLAWQGRTGTSRPDALRGLGIEYAHSRAPKWASDGHIPWEWQERIKAQIA
jgi:hypothetical protein